MSHTMTIKYLGELRTEGTHLKSGNTVITDAPPDNKGKGMAYSPTDLLCSSLAACMLTIMGIAANTHGIKMGPVTAEITKIMGSDPRRVIEIIISFTFENGSTYNDKERSILQHAALHCPVAKSLNPELKQTVNFNY